MEAYKDPRERVRVRTIPAKTRASESDIYPRMPADFAANDVRIPQVTRRLTSSFASSPLTSHREPSLRSPVDRIRYAGCSVNHRPVPLDAELPCVGFCGIVVRDCARASARPPWQRRRGCRPLPFCSSGTALSATSTRLGPGWASEAEEIGVGRRTCRRSGYGQARSGEAQRTDN